VDHFDDIDDRDFRGRLEPDVEEEPFEPTWFSPDPPKRFRGRLSTV